MAAKGAFQVRGIECRTAGAAADRTQQTGGRAVLIRGRGPFAGRILTVPVG